MPAYQAPSAVVCSCGERFESAWSVDAQSTESRRRLRRHRLPANQSALWLFLRHQAARLAKRSGECKPHSGAAKVFIRCATCAESIDINHYRQHVIFGGCTIATTIVESKSVDRSSANSFECHRCLDDERFQQLDVSSLVSHSHKDHHAVSFHLYVACQQCDARVPLSDVVGHAAYWHPDRLRSGFADLFVPSSSNGHELLGDERPTFPLAVDDETIVFDAADLQRDEIGADQPNPPEFPAPDEICRVWPLFECKVCAVTFREKHDLTVHQRRHAPPHPYRCRQCGASYTSRSRLQRHGLLKHSGREPSRSRVQPRPFACTRCDKRFTGRGKLALHVLHHTGEKPVACTYPACGSVFVCDSSRKMHLARLHGVGDYKCSECGECYAYRNLLDLHMLSHADKLPYPCNQCDLAFPTRQRLKCHMRVHSDDRPYSCQQCSKSFKTKTNLGQHSAVHREERPFRCEPCGKAFKFAQALRLHSKMH